MQFWNMNFLLKNHVSMIFLWIRLKVHNNVPVLQATQKHKLHPQTLIHWYTKIQIHRRCSAKRLAQAYIDMWEREKLKSELKCSKLQDDNVT